MREACTRGAEDAVWLIRPIKLLQTLRGSCSPRGPGYKLDPAHYRGAEAAGPTSGQLRSTQHPLPFRGPSSLCSPRHPSGSPCPPGPDIGAPCSPLYYPGPQSSSRAALSPHFLSPGRGSSGLIKGFGLREPPQVTHHPESPPLITTVQSRPGGFAPGALAMRWALVYVRGAGTLKLGLVTAPLCLSLLLCAMGVMMLPTSQGGGG